MYFESATKVFTASVQCDLNQRQETFLYVSMLKLLARLVCLKPGLLILNLNSKNLIFLSFAVRELEKLKLKNLNSDLDYISQTR